VYHKYFVHNRDSKRPEFASGTGIYQPGCGFRNVIMSWGHDEYMYQVIFCFYYFFVPRPGGRGKQEEGCVEIEESDNRLLSKVCMQNKSTLPEKALYIIRFHSFYPFHQGGAYKDLMDDTDREMLHWVKVNPRFFATATTKELTTSCHISFKSHRSFKNAIFTARRKRDLM